MISRCTFARHFLCHGHLSFHFFLFSILIFRFNSVVSVLLLHLVTIVYFLVAYSRGVFLSLLTLDT